jgi:CRP-like cAMP-binding protein
MDELSRRLEKAENRIEDIGLSTVTMRVARALLELFKNPIDKNKKVCKYNS